LNDGLGKVCLCCGGYECGDGVVGVTDDIVTRLRERIPYAIHPHVLAEAKLLSDAVKEIERLRVERDQYKKLAEDWQRIAEAPF